MLKYKNVSINIPQTVAVYFKHTIYQLKVRRISVSSHTHSEHCPGECRVASSVQQEQRRTMGTAAVNSENVQGSQGNSYQSCLSVIKSVNAV